ncbi:MAG: hypothetical protein IPN47_24315 [Gemmatimonadetes bacterium]|nr:hypothetical protein [Gemmatimonadota bacterium]
MAQIRAARRELRGGATEHLFVSDQVYVYRRGGTIVAINNGRREASDVTIPRPRFRRCVRRVRRGRPVNGATVVRVPARVSCIF